MGRTTVSPQWLTTKELAERFRTNESTVRFWHMQGYGPPSVKIGRRRLYDLAKVEKWEAERAAEGGDAA
jgi:DNA-binding transcriptional MerR regulator